MLYYPQLVTGAIGQYPLKRENVRRTVVNTLDDGSDIRTEDWGAADVRWELDYLRLLATELSALQDLYAATYGCWGTFTFLDPADNLLRFSEDLTQSCWVLDPLLTLGAGQPDAFGGKSGTQVTNSAQVVQALSQSLDGPSWYQYCLSVYLRSEQPATVDLFGSCDGEESTTTVAVGTDWTRAAHSLQLSTRTDGVRMGIRVAPGQRVTAFGFQSDAQPGASGYRRTRDRAGIYPAARFDDDRPRWTQTGVDEFACSVRVVGRAGG